MLSSEPSFKIGDRVRWRPDIMKVAWVGVVSGYPHPRMVQCDGRGCISQGLLEKVGEMTGPEMQEMADVEYNLHLMTEERDGMAATAAMQCELIMELQTAAAACTKQLSKITEKSQLDDDWFEGLIDRLELYLVRHTGSRRPVAIADPDLRALVAHIVG